MPFWNWSSVGAQTSETDDASDSAAGNPAGGIVGPTDVSTKQSNNETADTDISPLQTLNRIHETLVRNNELNEICNSQALQIEALAQTIKQLDGALSENRASLFRETENVRRLQDAISPRGTPFSQPMLPGPAQAPTPRGRSRGRSWGQGRGGRGREQVGNGDNVGAPVLTHDGSVAWCVSQIANERSHRLRETRDMTLELQKTRSDVKHLNRIVGQKDGEIIMFQTERSQFDRKMCQANQIVLNAALDINYLQNYLQFLQSRPSNGRATDVTTAISPHGDAENGDGDGAAVAAASGNSLTPSLSTIRTSAEEHSNAPPLPAQPFVVVLVDGDAYRWSSDHFKPQVRGYTTPGAHAAQRLKEEVQRWILTHPTRVPVQSKIVARVFCNANGTRFPSNSLAPSSSSLLPNPVAHAFPNVTSQGSNDTGPGTHHDLNGWYTGPGGNIMPVVPGVGRGVGVGSPNFPGGSPMSKKPARKARTTGQLVDFMASFTESMPLFDFFNAGVGKERADEKIKENFHLFVSNPACHAVFLAACTDNGFARLLEQYSNNTVARQKIVLVHCGYVIHEIERLRLENVVEWPDVFARHFLPKEIQTKHARQQKQRDEEDAIRERTRREGERRFGKDVWGRMLLQTAIARNVMDVVANAANDHVRTRALTGATTAADGVHVHNEADQDGEGDSQDENEHGHDHGAGYYCVDSGVD